MTFSDALALAATYAQEHGLVVDQEWLEEFADETLAHAPRPAVVEDSQYRNRYDI